MCVYIYIYTCIYIYIYTCVCIYIYIPKTRSERSSARASEVPLRSKARPGLIMILLLLLIIIMIINMIMIVNTY